MTLHGPEVFQLAVASRDSGTEQVGLTKWQPGRDSVGAGVCVCVYVRVHNAQAVGREGDSGVTFGIAAEGRP